MQDEKKFEEEIKEEEVADTPTADEAPIDEEQSAPVDDLANEEEPEEQLDDVASDIPAEEDGIKEDEEPYQEPVEKMLTQSQVNELVGRARQEGRDSAMRDLYGRYGVNGDDELNDVFGRGQAYDGLNDEFIAQGDRYKHVMAENALLKSHVDENRWEDIKLILGGKGLDISQENIEELLPTHPEWRSGMGAEMQVPAPAQGEQPGQMLSLGMAEQFANNAAINNVPKKPVTTLRKLGNDIAAQNPEENENEKLKQLFGF